jgi:hypothetical protein
VAVTFVSRNAAFAGEFTPFRPCPRSTAIHRLKKEPAMTPTLASPLRRRGLLATGALAALLGIADVPAACADTRLVRVEVVDRDHAQTLHVWRDRGRPVVAGRPGDRYSVRLVNDSGERVLAVVAIDGINVISGETAAVGQRGYVLGPWQRMEVTGWRKSDEEVAAFEFTSLPDSYAARTGRPRDVGVIGVAVFREARSPEVSDARPAPRVEGMAKAAPPPAVPAPPAESRRADGASAADAAAPTARPEAPVARERLGTGHGERESSVVEVVTFERAGSRPDQRLEIRYDSLENLVAAGIVPPPRVATTAPHAFPADRDFVPDPPLR